MAASSIAERDFQRLFESAPALYLVLTPQLEIAAVSDAYLRATMTRREAIMDRGIFDVFPDNPNDPEATGVRNLRASLERVMTQGVADTMAVQKYDIRRPEAEGGGFEERYWSPMNSPVFGQNGEVIYIIHRVEDVTEFVRLRQQGVESDKVTAELRGHAEHMEAEVFLRAGEVQEANRKLEAANEELARLADMLRKALHSRDRDVVSLAKEITLRNTDLEKVLAEQKEIEDMLRARNAEISSMTQQLWQTAKLATMGELAASVAHELNNPLTIVSLRLESLLARIAKDDPARQSLEVIDHELERMSKLVANLLQFSRRSGQQVSTLDICEELERTLDLVQYRLRNRGIAIVRDAAPDLPPIHADRQQLRQVFLNLFSNASDAMPQGGRLTLCVAPSVALGMPAVKVDISDTGCGIAPEVLHQVTEAFYTTKAEGKGTGLGLAICRRIVQQHQGTLEITSEVGRGTTVHIVLPQHQ